MMTVSSPRRLLTVVVLLALTGLVATGCVRFPAPESPPPTATAGQPMLPGVQVDVPVEPPPSSEACNATLTLRPPAQMPPPRQMPINSTMAGILERGRLIVGLDIGSNLFSFRDPITGDIQGFDVDIAHEIAGAIFGDDRRVEFQVLSSAQRIDALRDMTVDLVIKTMSITCDRLRDISFSAPYYVASQRILSFRNSNVTGPAQLADKRVCAARGTTSIGRIQAIQPRATIVSTTTWADCLVLMQQGQIDAATTDDAILAGLAAQDPWLRVVGPSLGEEFYGVGIPKGQDDMIRFVNGVLERIRVTGRWQEIRDRWLSILDSGYGAPQPYYRD
ncbi:glutamate ABC transporter substrate-binding protein [Gordonia sp. SCSIO 19800]|uniref:glutamate ABC transporter substrate-binding protein n=1 Tax=Gordonia sp. SCSIO 19800 TaxID=2826926 RepID=UPI001B82A2D6|nr:glutamate ABC transporter substrate-binding protein [Gordonia sp. SCSIO 19800]MBR7193621.1 glutamate ABC transporter substrate-binding protein [Gordonia sp. SCSIO 19800]